ncbi:CHAD domain-containing protein [Salicola sp. Rm-C-2C1-2]|uniref:CHAD domain-containing protein n=1 Tax=Salicola sp. Rm-C-2C1-2 TaxID=3141321 RepID=UPI0032E4A70E
MKTLFLVRHGKSSWKDESRPDDERPLKKRGRRQASALSPALRDAGAFEGSLFISPAKRAQQTARAIVGALPDGDTVQVQVHNELYTFDRGRLLSWLQSQTPQSPLVIIGHNPALLNLANRLLNIPLQALPTGGAVQITLPGRSWRQVGRQTGECSDVLLPEHLDYKLFRRNAPKAPGMGGKKIKKRIPASLQHQARLIEALEPGVRRGYDPEFLHQFRVNIRRSRAIGESMERILKDSTLKKGLKGLKRQGRETSHLRDLDVFLETLSNWREVPERREAIDALDLQTWFQRKQADEHLRLCQVLDSDQYAKDMQRWSKLVQGDTVAKLANRIKRKRIRYTLDEQIARHDRLFNALTPTSTDTDFHQVRKSLKRVRYLIDLDSDHLAGNISGLKERQKRFGHFQDLHVQMTLLDEVASQNLSDSQHHALSQLIDQLRIDQQQTRNKILTLEPLAVPVTSRGMDGG